MNLQTHMSGQFSGQVPNQAGTSLSGIPQQQNMMQNPGGQRSALNMEPGFVKARRFIQERIYAFLMQRQQTQEIAQKKVMDIVRRLEEGLFKTATTKEEYMNLETLETRLHILIKRLPLSNQNQQYQQQANTSVPMGTMIPNPGMPQSGNSNIMVPSSMDTSFVGAGGGNSMMSSAVNTYAGGLTNGYQQPTSNFSNNLLATDVITTTTNIPEIIGTPQKDKTIGRHSSEIKTTPPPYTGMQTRSKTDMGSDTGHKSAKRVLFPEEATDTKKKKT